MRKRNVHIQFWLNRKEAEGFIFRTVSYNTSGSFYDVITQVSVSSFAHVFVFGYEIVGVIIVPNDTTVFRKSIGIMESLNPEIRVYRKLWF